MSPQDDEQQSDWRTRAIDVARSYLQKQDGKPIDATFSARRSAEGYNVFIEFIGGYDEHGQPRYFPGGHCLVQVSKDWKVVEVVPGA